MLQRKRSRRLPSRAKRRSSTIAPAASAVLRLRTLARSVLQHARSVVERRLFPAIEMSHSPGLKRDAMSRHTDLIEDIRVEITETTDVTGLKRVAQSVAETIANKNAQEQKRLFGIPVRKQLPVHQIEVFRDRNVQKITSLVGKQLDQIDDLLADAQTAGWTADALKEKIRQQFGVSESKADLLARDQTLKFNAALTKERQQQAGVTKYIWTSSGDERVREGHMLLDGTIQSWDSPPDTGDGQHNHPGEDYQCRCDAFPLVEELDSEA